MQMVTLAFRDQNEANFVQQVIQLRFGKRYQAVNAPPNILAQGIMPGITLEIAFYLYQGGHGDLHLIYPVPNTGQNAYGTITDYLRAYGHL